jgi:hypothetical protein
MSSPTQYRCEEKVVNLLENKNLSLNALRLVHAAYHHLDNHVGWTPATMALPAKPDDDRVCTVLCAELCATTGTPGANDIRMVREGVRDLEGTGLFQTLELDGRKLRFRFSKTLADATQRMKKPRFAILECDLIAKLRTPWQVLFYTQAEMVTRQQRPMFYLPRVCPIYEPWSDTKRTWLSTASCVGKHLGQDYIFIPELDAKRDSVVAVKVKITHQRTNWSVGKLSPKRAIEPISVAAQAKSNTLTRQELDMRRDWTQVTGP